MKFIAPLMLLFVSFLSEPAATSQFQAARDTETTVTETAYTVVPSYGGKYKVIVAIAAINPFEDRFASHPSVRITLRAADGSVITTREVSSAGIPPKNRIALCESLYADEAPAKVEFRPLKAGYEETIYRPANFLWFELLNLRERDDGSGRVRNNRRNQKSLCRRDWSVDHLSLSGRCREIAWWSYQVRTDNTRRSTHAL